MNQLKKKSFLSLDDSLYSDYNAENININKSLTTPQKNILEDTFYLQVAMITTIAALAVLPESISKWDKDQASTSQLGVKWKKM